MATTTSDRGTRERTTRNHVSENELSIPKTSDHLRHREVDFEPTTDAWKSILAGGAATLGLAGAAAFATYVSKHERVAMTAWIAVAIAGSASVIAAASASRRRTVSR